MRTIRYQIFSAKRLSNIFCQEIVQYFWQRDCQIFPISFSSNQVHSGKQILAGEHWFVLICIWFIRFCSQNTITLIWQLTSSQYNVIYLHLLQYWWILKAIQIHSPRTKFQSSSDHLETIEKTLLQGTKIFILCNFMFFLN